MDRQEQHVNTIILQYIGYEINDYVLNKHNILININHNNCTNKLY